MYKYYCRYVHADCDESIDPMLFNTKRGAPDPFVDYQCPVCKHRDGDVSIVVSDIYFSYFLHSERLLLNMLTGRLIGMARQI